MNRLVILAAGVGLTAGTASAGVLATLNASLNVDNQFTAYVSSDPGAAGTQFLSGGSWPTTYSGSFDITEPGTYYLHIRAEDVGRPAMFIGNFSLSDAQGTFDNGTQSLLTQADGGWQASTTGFGGADVGVVDIGPNGMAPWGNFPAHGSARFIWSTGSPTPLVVYFSTTITVVPSPSSAGLVLSVGALGVFRRRRTTR